MADEAPSGHYKDFPSRLARKCMTTRERLDRDRRRNFLIAFTGFGMSIVAVVAGLIRPECTREFVVVFFIGLALFGGSFAHPMFSGRCVHCQQPLGKWLIELPSDNPFRVDPHDVQFCPYCGKSLDDDATT
jgi:hypothetical protein